MAEWWASLQPLQRVFAYLALPGTAILIIQTILLFFGIGNGESDGDVAEGGMDFEGGVEVDGGIDIDGDGIPDVFPEDGEAPGPSGGDGGLSLFTIRGIVAFLAIAGWVGIALIDLGFNPIFSCLVAIVSGLAAMVLIAMAFKHARKLESTGNVQTKNALGLSGQVYLRIPPARSGQGKIHLTVQDRYREFDAVTDYPDPLKTGAEITVLEVLDNNLLVVAPNQYALQTPEDSGETL